MSAPGIVALVGLPGSGKTTIAPLLAERLQRSCVDLDAQISTAAGKPAGTVIREQGEPAFRALERAALEQALAGERPIVIACGGGVLTEPGARQLLLDRACVVWLDAPDDVLLSRLGDGSARPLLGDDPAASLPRLRALRQAGFATAHLRVPATTEPAQVAATIAAAVAGSVRIAVPGRAYHVEVRPDALADAALHLPAGSERVALIADRAMPAAARRLAAELRRQGRQVTRIAVAGGERQKTWQAAGRMLTRLSRAGIRRQDCVVALGGGTVGDVAGFAAAVHLRGVAWVNVPTTLLAMVDSAVGGKTGVNTARGKNLAGAVWQPRAVICDPLLLRTLPERAYRSAFAEMVKYCMIRDSELFGLLDAHLDGLLQRDPDLLAQAVRVSCALKGEVVAADEREAGARAVLNYGHTVGHALEAATAFGRALNHGEAVALGMRAAGLLSVRLLGCPAGDVAWQDALLDRCGFDGAPPLERRRVLDHMEADKKSRDGHIGWVLLARRGLARFGQTVPEPEVREALDAILTR